MPEENVHDFSKELDPLLSEEVREAISIKVLNTIGYYKINNLLLECKGVDPFAEEEIDLDDEYFGTYEVKYLGITFYKLTQKETALKEMARKLQVVYDTYGIVGCLSLCLGLDLCGPEAVTSPTDPNWDYKKEPIGPGTWGWGKTKEEQDNLRDRCVMLSYPALDSEVAQTITGEQIFIEEGTLPPVLEQPLFEEDGEAYTLRPV
jgi:hypothetical protein